jgi:hypothetical protein
MEKEKAKVEKSEIIAVSASEFNEFGCPHCGYRSCYSHVSSGGASLASCECGKSFIVLADGVRRSSIGIGNGNEETVYPELQSHPRKGIPKHGAPDKRPRGEGEFFYSRGIGTDHTPGCFVCGGKDKMHHNIAAFVKCKEAGERVVAMFSKGARLDYREHEPDRVQVKIGSCNNHRSNLEKLAAATKDEIITQEKVNASMAL